MISKEEYKTLVKNNSKKSPLFKDCFMAFLIGGLICAIGQGLIELYKLIGMGEQDSMTLCSVTLVFFGVLLTFLHCYDNIAKHAGAGTLVPITGFANSIASPSIEFKTEGLITGLGAKMFIIAGPVIVYGMVSGAIYGLVLWILKLFGIVLF